MKTKDLNLIHPWKLEAIDDKWDIYFASLMLSVLYGPIMAFIITERWN